MITRQCDIKQNPVQYDIPKHVEVDIFFIKKELEENIVAVPHVPSEDQLANVFTKPVSNRIFSKLNSKSGMINIYALT